LKYLIDTVVWMWVLDSYERVRPAVRRVFEDGEDDVFLSPVTTWEISIKMRQGKLNFPGPPDRKVPEFIAEQRLQALPITHKHAAKVYDLPTHHNDPFDRMLIAQALVEELTLISSDEMFKKYSVPLLWAGR
jgi:PIN domain nuclease of toxin-antitoxin system